MPGPCSEGQRNEKLPWWRRPVTWCCRPCLTWLVKRLNSSEERARDSELCSAAPVSPVNEWKLLEKQLSQWVWEMEGLLFNIILLLSLLFVQFNTNYKCAVKNGSTSMKTETEMFQNNNEHRCFLTVLPQNDYFNLMFKNTSYTFYLFLPIVLQVGKGTTGAKNRSLSQLHRSGSGVTSHWSHQFIVTKSWNFLFSFPSPALTYYPLL